MRGYLIIHKQEGDERWEVEQVENFMLPHNAVEETLTDGEIVNEEFILFEVGNSIHSDQFHNDGVLDHVYERFEKA